MLRLFRALRSVSGFTITVFSFAQVVPLMARYFAVLFCILFSYAVLGECTCARVLVRCVHARSAVPSHAHALTMTACVCGCGALAGMELFAGKLVASNPMVAASSYGTNDYYVNNFDTLVRARVACCAVANACALCPRVRPLTRLACAAVGACGWGSAPQQNSVVVLFEQLVVNNWPIVMEGCVAATTLWARTYFLIFYGFCVVAVLSVLVRRPPPPVHAAHGLRVRATGGNSCVAAVLARCAACVLARGLRGEARVQPEGGEDPGGARAAW